MHESARQKWRNLWRCKFVTSYSNTTTSGSLTHTEWSNRDETLQISEFRPSFCLYMQKKKKGNSNIQSKS